MMMRLFPRLLPFILLCAGQVLPAHVVFSDPQAKAGGYHAAFLRVSHGCGSSPTTSVRVEIPAAVVLARPQPKPGWTVTVERVSLAAPIRSESGAEVRERASAITWTGRLGPEEFDQFGIMMKLSDQAGLVYFPTVQRCESGANEWTAIPAAGQSWGSLKTPAPYLDVRRPEPAATSHQH
jgi:hypothetical protein